MAAASVQPEEEEEERKGGGGTHSLPSPENELARPYSSFFRGVECAILWVGRASKGERGIRHFALSPLPPPPPPPPLLLLDKQDFFKGGFVQRRKWEFAGFVYVCIQRRGFAWPCALFCVFLRAVAV